MEVMRRIAFATVMRACGFGSLAIFCIMIAMSFEPRAAFMVGAVLTLLMTLVLLVKAYESRTKDHRRTEMWLYLPEEHRPGDDHAQWATATVLRDTYLAFARYTSLVSIAMGALALAFSMFGG